MAFSINYDNFLTLNDALRQKSPNINYNDFLPEPTEEQKLNPYLGELARQQRLTTQQYQDYLQEQIRLQEEQERQRASQIYEESARVNSQLEQEQNNTQNVEPELKQSTKSLTDEQRVELYKAGKLNDEKYIKDLENESDSYLRTVYGNATANYVRERIIRQARQFNALTAEVPESIKGSYKEDVAGFLVGVGEGIAGIGDTFKQLHALTISDSKERLERLREIEKNSIDRSKRGSIFAGVSYQNELDYSFFLRDIYNDTFNDTYSKILSQTGDEEVAKREASKEANQFYRDVNYITTEFMVQGFGSQIPQIMLALISGGAGSSVAKHLTNKSIKNKVKQIYANEIKQALTSKEMKEAFKRIAINTAKYESRNGLLGAALGSGLAFGTQDYTQAYQMAVLRSYEQYEQMSDEEKDALFNSSEMLKLKEETGIEDRDELFAYAVNQAGKEAGLISGSITGISSMLAIPTFMAVFNYKALNGLVSRGQRMGLIVADIPTQFGQEFVQELGENIAPRYAVNKELGYDLFKDIAPYDAYGSALKGATLASAFSATTSARALTGETIGAVKGKIRKTKKTLADEFKNIKDNAITSITNGLDNLKNDFNNLFKRNNKNDEFNFIGDLNNEITDINESLRDANKEEIQSTEEGMNFLINETQNQINKQEEYSKLSDTEKQAKEEEISRNEINIKILNQKLNNVSESILTEYQETVDAIPEIDRQAFEQQRKLQVLESMRRNGQIDESNYNWQKEKILQKIDELGNQKIALENKLQSLTDFMNSETFTKIQDTINRGNNVNFITADFKVNSDGTIETRAKKFDFENFEFDNAQIRYKKTEVIDSINNSNSEAETHNLVLGFIKKSSDDLSSLNTEEALRTFSNDVREIKQALDDKGYSNEFIDNLSSALDSIRNQIKDPTLKKAWLTEDGKFKKSLEVFVDKLFRGYTEKGKKLPSLAQIALDMMSGDKRKNQQAVNSAKRLLATQKEKLDALQRTKEKVKNGEFKSGEDIPIFLGKDKNGNSKYLQNRDGSEVIFKGKTKQDILRQMDRYIQTVETEYQSFEKMLSTLVNKNENFIKDTTQRVKERRFNANTRNIKNKIDNIKKDLIEKVKESGESWTAERDAKLTAHLEKTLNEKGEEGLNKEVQRLNEIYDKKIENNKSKVENADNTVENSTTEITENKPIEQTSEIDNLGSEEKVDNSAFDTDKLDLRINTRSLADNKNTLNNSIKNKDNNSWKDLFKNLPDTFKKASLKGAKKLLQALNAPIAFKDGVLYFDPQSKPKGLKPATIINTEILLKEMFGQDIEISFEPVPENKIKPVSKTETSKDNKINIKSGEGKYSRLSNFAERRFKRVSGQEYYSVEQAYQLAKFNFVDETQLSAEDKAQNARLKEQMNKTTDGRLLQKLGKQIKGLNTKQWDKNKFILASEFIRDSFEQNPDALFLLLQTGDAELTHNVSDEFWAKNFPLILMKLREEYKYALENNNNKSLPARFVEINNFINKSVDEFMDKAQKLNEPVNDKRRQKARDYLIEKYIRHGKKSLQAEVKKINETYDKKISANIEENTKPENIDNSGSKKEDIKETATKTESENKTNKSKLKEKQQQRRIKDFDNNVAKEQGEKTRTKNWKTLVADKELAQLNPPRKVSSDYQSGQGFIEYTLEFNQERPTNGDSIEAKLKEKFGDFLNVKWEQTQSQQQYTSSNTGSKILEKALNPDEHKDLIIKDFIEHINKKIKDVYEFIKERLEQGKDNNQIKDELSEGFNGNASKYGFEDIFTLYPFVENELISPVEKDINALSKDDRYAYNFVKKYKEKGLSDKEILKKADLDLNEDFYKIVEDFINQGKFENIDKQLKNNQSKEEEKISNTGSEEVKEEVNGEIKENVSVDEPEVAKEQSKKFIDGTAIEVNNKKIIGKNNFYYDANDANLNANTENHLVNRFIEAVDILIQNYNNKKVSDITASNYNLETMVSNKELMSLLKEWSNKNTTAERKEKLKELILKELSTNTALIDNLYHNGFNPLDVKTIEKTVKSIYKNKDARKVIEGLEKLNTEFKDKEFSKEQIEVIKDILLGLNTELNEEQLNNLVAEENLQDTYNFVMTMGEFIANINNYLNEETNIPLGSKPLVKKVNKNQKDYIDSFTGFSLLGKVDKDGNIVYDANTVIGIALSLIETIQIGSTRGNGNHDLLRDYFFDTEGGVALQISDITLDKNILQEDANGIYRSRQKTINGEQLSDKILANTSNLPTEDLSYLGTNLSIFIRNAGEILAKNLGLSFGKLADNTKNSLIGSLGLELTNIILNKHLANLYKVELYTSVSEDGNLPANGDKTYLFINFISNNKRETNHFSKDVERAIYEYSESMKDKDTHFMPDVLSVQNKKTSSTITHEELVNKQEENEKILDNVDRLNNSLIRVALSTIGFMKSAVVDTVFSGSVKDSKGYTLTPNINVEPELREVNPIRDNGDDVLDTIPERLAKNIENHNKTPYKFDPFMVNLLDHKQGVEILNAIGSVVADEQLAGFLPEYAQTIRARNNIVLSALNFINEVKNEANNLSSTKDAVIYFFNTAIKTQRVRQVAQNNPQNNKVVREFIVAHNTLTEDKLKEAVNIAKKHLNDLKDTNLTDLDLEIILRSAFTDFTLQDSKPYKGTRNIDTLTTRINELQNLYDTGKITKEQLIELSQSQGLLLGIAQALGVKVEKQKISNIVKELNTKLNKWENWIEPLLQDIYKLHTDGKNAEIDITNFQRLGDEFNGSGQLGAMRAFSALKVYAQYKYGNKGETISNNLYLEADGIANGMSNIVFQFANRLSADYFNLIEQVGVVPPQKVFEIFSKLKQAQKDNPNRTITLNDAGEFLNKEEIKDLFEMLEGSAGIFDRGKDKNGKSLSVEDVYQKVATHISSNVFNALNNIQNSLNLDILKEQVFKKSNVNIDNLTIKDFLFDEKLRNKITYLKTNNNPVLKQFKKDFENLYNALAFLQEVVIINGTIKGNINISGSNKDFSIKYLNKLLNVNINKTPNLSKTSFELELARNFTKIGMTPRVYGGKITGINNQLRKDIVSSAKKFLNDFYLLNQEILNKENLTDTEIENFNTSISFLNNWLKLNNLYDESNTLNYLQYTENSNKEDLINENLKSLKNISKDIANKSYLIEQRTESIVSNVLLKNINNLYDNVFKKQEYAVKLDSLSIAIFREELADKIKQRIKERNEKKGYTEFDPRRNDDLSSKEILALIKSLPSSPFISTAFSNETNKLLEHIIQDAHTIIKKQTFNRQANTMMQQAVSNYYPISAKDSKFKQFNADYFSNALSAQIVQRIELFVAGGALNYTTPVVSTESRVQAFIAELQNELGIASSDVYDGNESNYSLAQLFGIMANQEYINVHQNYNLLESLFDRFNRLNIYEYMYLNIPDIYNKIFEGLNYIFDNYHKFVQEDNILNYIKNNEDIYDLTKQHNNDKIIYKDKSYTYDEIYAKAKDTENKYSEAYQNLLKSAIEDFLLQNDISKSFTEANPESVQFGISLLNTFYNFTGIENVEDLSSNLRKIFEKILVNYTANGSIIRLNNEELKTIYKFINEINNEFKDAKTNKVDAKRFIATIKDNYNSYMTSLAQDISVNYAMQKLEEKYLTYGVNQFAGSNRGIITNIEQLFKDKGTYQKWLTFNEVWLKSDKPVNAEGLLYAQLTEPEKFVYFLKNEPSLKKYLSTMVSKKYKSMKINSLGNSQDKAEFKGLVDLKQTLDSLNLQVGEHTVKVDDIDLTVNTVIRNSRRHNLITMESFLNLYEHLLDKGIINEDSEYFRSVEKVIINVAKKMSKNGEKEAFYFTFDNVFQSFNDTTEGNTITLTNGTKIISLNTNSINKSFRQTILHELVHGILGTFLSEVYNGNNYGYPTLNIRKEIKQEIKENLERSIIKFAKTFRHFSNVDKFKQNYILPIISYIPENASKKDVYEMFYQNGLFNGIDEIRQTFEKFSAGVYVFFVDSEYRNNPKYDTVRETLMHEFIAYGLTEENSLQRFANLPATKSKNFKTILKNIFTQVKNQVAKLFFGSKDTNYLKAHSKEMHSALFDLLADITYIGEHTRLAITPNYSSTNTTAKVNNKIFDNTEIVKINNKSRQNTSKVNAHDFFMQDLMTELKNLDYVSKVNTNTSAQDLYNTKIEDVKNSSYLTNLRNKGVFLDNIEENLFHTMVGVYQLAFQNTDSDVKQTSLNLLNKVFKNFDKIDEFKHLKEEDIFNVKNYKDVDLATAMALITSSKDIYNSIIEYIDKEKGENTFGSKLLSNGLIKNIADKFNNNTYDNNIITRIAYSAVKTDIANSLNDAVQKKIKEDALKTELTRQNFRLSLKDTLNKYKVPPKFANLITDGLEEFYSSSLHNARLGETETKIGNFIQDFITKQVDKHGKMTVIAHILRWFLQSRDNTQLIYEKVSSLSTQIDMQVNKTKSIIPEIIIEKFNGAFTEDIDNLISRTVIPNKLNRLYSLYKNNFGTFSRLLTDDVFRDNTINKTLQNLQVEIKNVLDTTIPPKLKDKTNVNEVLNWIHWQSMGLAQLMITGSAHSHLGESHHILPNTSVISSLNPLLKYLNNFAPNNGDIRVRKLLPYIDELVSLYTLKLLNQEDLNNTVSLINENKEGMELLFNTLDSIESKYNKRNSKSLLGYDGYVASADTYENINISLENATYSETDLSSLGYTDYMEIPVPYSKNGKYKVKITNTAIKERFTQGMLNFTNLTHKGVNVENGSILGVVEGKVILDTDDFLTLKAERERMYETVLKNNSNFVNSYWLESLNNKNATDNFNSIMQPIIDSEGNIAGYTYILPKNIKEQINPSLNTGVESLGAEYSRILEENLTEVENIKNIDLLNKLKNDDINHQNQYFQITIDETEKGYEINIDLPETGKNEKYIASLKQLINNLPLKTRQYIESNGLWLNKTEIDNILGYKKFNIMNILSGIEKPDETAKQGFLAMVSAFLGELPNNATARSILVNGEKFIKETVSFSKDVVLNRTGIVPAGNLFFNALHLFTLGINPVVIYQQSKIGLAYIKQYEDNYNEYIKTSFLLNTINEPKLLENLQSRKIILTKLLQENPIHYLMKKGLYSNIVSETAYENPEMYEFLNKSDKNSIFRQIGEYTGISKYKDKLFDNKTLRGKVLSNVLITPESRVHRFMENSINYGDFIAKFILINHYMNKHNFSKDRAIEVAREEFVNYSMNRGATFDYLNSMGLMWYGAYATGIQKVIIKKLRQNFLGSAVMFASGVNSSTFNPIQEQNFISKNWDYVFSPSNTFDSWESHYFLQYLQWLFGK